MRRVVILGRGAAGKSGLARQLGDLTGLPVLDLDTMFWQPGLTPAEPADGLPGSASCAAATPGSSMVTSAPTIRT